MFKHLFTIMVVGLLSQPSMTAQRQYWLGAGLELAETQGLAGWAYGLQSGVAWRQSYAGVFVRQTTTLAHSNNPAGLPYRISIQYAGLLGAWHRPAIGALEIGVGVQLGLGRAIRIWDNQVGLPNDKDALLAVVPFAGLELPIGGRFRISAHSGYRFFGGLNGIDQWHSRDFWALANSIHVRMNLGSR